MKSILLKLLFSAFFWSVMLLSSGKLKELFKKEKVESLTADFIEYIFDNGKQYLKFTVKNDTSSELCYGTDGYLSQKINGEYIVIETKEDFVPSAAAYYIAPGDMKEYMICLSDCYDYLQPGFYKYTKAIGCLSIDVEFEVL